MQFDKNLELKTSGAVTSTASTTGVAVNVRPQREYTCVIAVTAVKTSITDETYVLEVEVSDLVGGTYTAVGTIPAVQTTGVGNYKVPLSGPWVAKLDADSAFIRLTATLGGTDPSVTYQAYLTKA